MLRTTIYFSLISKRQYIKEFYKTKLFKLEVFQFIDILLSYNSRIYKKYFNYFVKYTLDNLIRNYFEIVLQLLF